MNKKKKEPKKRKKVDYKKWANKYLKSGYPLEMERFSGLGEGRILYCPTCDTKCNFSYFTQKRNDDKPKWYCKECGKVTVKMSPTQFNKFRKEQREQNDKDTD